MQRQVEIHAKIGVKQRELLCAVSRIIRVVDVQTIFFGDLSKDTMNNATIGLTGTV